ncbi:MAG: PilZ domain-containing protein [Desulfobacteraceae bacterium]|jgi:hypothetical protein|nr:PilZ domain-containing protein [Desulfobacteraceae bacterium]
MQPADHPDRRRASRYSAAAGASVRVCTPASEFGGFLVDVSLSGAAFEYVFLDEPLKEGHRLDIRSDKDGIGVENLSFQVVSDLQLSDPSPEPVVWRRAGIRFVSLSHEQKSQLTELIRRWGHQVPRTVPVAGRDSAAILADEIFISRLKLLNIAAKAYLGGYPYGFYRESAISRNAMEILRFLPQQKAFRFGETHSPLLEKHIARLSTAFSEFPVKAHGAATLEESIDYVSDHLRVEKSLTQMAFLKVA